MNMQESLDEMRAEAEEATRKKVLAKHMHEMQSLSKSQAAQAVAKTLAFDSHAHKHAHDKEANSTNSRSRSRSRNGNSIDSSSSSEDERGFAARLRHMLRHFRGSRRNADGTVVKYLTHKEKRKMADMAEMRGLLMQAWAGTAKAKDYHHDLDITQEGTLEKYIRNGGVLARHIMENRNFQNFITLVILLTAIVVGLEANAPNPTAEETAAFEAIEDLIFVIFTLEVHTNHKQTNLIHGTLTPPPPSPFLGRWPSASQQTNFTSRSTSPTTGTCSTLSSSWSPKVTLHRSAPRSSLCLPFAPPPHMLAQRCAF